MPVNSFYNLLVRIEPFIRKEDTHLCESISPGARLEAALPFLATVSHALGMSLSHQMPLAECCFPIHIALPTLPHMEIYCDYICISPCAQA